MRLKSTNTKRARAPRTPKLAAAACAFLLLSAACGGANPGEARQAATPQQPARLTAGDLAKLRWIEGDWRGTGDVDKPFFERYRFEGDSALLVDSFDDEARSKVTDTTRFELTDGRLGNTGDGPRWAATEITDDSVTFAPLAKARNSFRWQRESKDVWNAVLDWPEGDGKPARRRVYRMERLPPAKP